MTFMRTRNPLSAAVYTLSAIIIAIAACVSFTLTDGSTSELPSTVCQVGEAPVAEIDEIPDVVSNCSTTLELIGSGSYDPDGNITSYVWELEHDGSVVTLTGAVVHYQVKAIGLYTIKLTVTDEDGNSGVDFTAVYAVADVDDDALPDWWETRYFDSLSHTGASDPDGDGLSNLDEFNQHTNPMIANSDDGVLERYWWELAVALIVIAVVSISLVYLRQRRKRRDDERRKIEYAIEIQKALDEE